MFFCLTKRSKTQAQIIADSRTRVCQRTFSVHHRWHRQLFKLLHEFFVLETHKDMFLCVILQCGVPVENAIDLWQIVRVSDDYGVAY